MIFVKESTAFAVAAALSVGFSFALAGTAAADSEAEKQKVLQCAKDICSMIVSKNATGPDLSCDLAKTWEKDDIQKGAESKSLSWGLGSARCSVKVNAKRSDIVSSLTSPEYSLKVDKQSISCEIERSGEKYPVSVTMAPELKFKDGKATNAALHMDNIEGATLIKGVVWTAATLEQNFGLLEGDTVREINRFVQKECPKIAADTK
jgi:hypothetical protein